MKKNTFKIKIKRGPTYEVATTQTKKEIDKKMSYFSPNIKIGGFTFTQSEIEKITQVN